MINAHDARQELKENNKTFEENANYIAKHLEELAEEAIQNAILQRTGKVNAIYSHKESYLQAAEELGLEVSPFIPKKWDPLLQRAREIANEELEKADYKGQKFYEGYDRQGYKALQLELKF